MLYKKTGSLEPAFSEKHLKSDRGGLILYNAKKYR